MAVRSANPESPSESTYRRIRSDIIFGRLAPGDRLRLERLRKVYDTSISTLREVLYRLFSERLIEAEGQKGFAVAHISEENFREVAAMRGLLEGHALREAFAAGDIDWEGRVVAAWHKLSRMEARMLAGDLSQASLWKHYDREFHRALISACGSRALLEAHALIFDRFLRYQILAIVFRGQAAADEHKAMLDCALARDAEGALAVLDRHIAACVDFTLERGTIKAKPGAASPSDIAGHARTDATAPATIGEGAYRRVRTDIIFGRIAPGQKMKLDRLRHTYDAGISTLREILSRLASEGLVVAEGQRGFEAAPVSVDNLREIAALRLLLEGFALEHSFAQGDVEWEGRVVAAHHKLAALERRMRDGDFSGAETWKRYDWEFHQELISACGSQVLMDTHAAVCDKYLRYQMIALSFRGDIAAREHLLLREAALNRDAATARKTLERHIHGGVEHALATGTIHA